jgi:hypothetical protein
MSSLGIAELTLKIPEQTATLHSVYCISIELISGSCSSAVPLTFVVLLLGVAGAEDVQDAHRIRRAALLQAIEGALVEVVQLDLCGPANSFATAPVYTSSGDMKLEQCEKARDYAFVGIPLAMGDT